MGCGSSQNGVQHPLRAPIISKKTPDKVDPHANSKYCNDSIVRSWFTSADEDGSGAIDFEEFKKSAIGKSLSDEEARNVFTSADMDKDGQIDYNEFVAALDEPKSPFAVAAAKAGLNQSNTDMSKGPSYPENQVCITQTELSRISVAEGLCLLK